jgi:N-acetylmuramoyl-L-alanine amidase
MKKFFLLITLFLGVFLTSYTDLSLKPNRVRRLIIDAGHGGKDPGTKGYKKIEEKKLALEIAYGVGALVKTHLKDVEIIYTRSTDEFVELRERARRANKEHGDMFISIHANASLSPEMNGTETYIMGLSASEDNLDVAKRENASILQEVNYRDKYDGYDPNSAATHILFMNYQNGYHYNSLRMANKIEDHFKLKLRRNSRGVKQSNFVVLWKTAMPSVLVEVGFLTNPAEESFLLGSAGKAHISDEIYKSFRDYKNEVENKER